MGCGSLAIVIGEIGGSKECADSTKSGELGREKTV